MSKISSITCAVREDASAAEECSHSSCPCRVAKTSPPFLASCTYVPRYLGSFRSSVLIATKQFKSP